MNITTAADLYAARQRLGWSLRQMARALRLAEAKGADRVREMEDDRRPLTGPVCVAVEAFLSGWRPEGWPSEAD